MDLVEYERHVRSEQAARRYLLKRCLNGSKPSCPRCSCQRLYRLADQRLRCGGCRYTFHEFTRRFVNRGGLSWRDWLRRCSASAPLFRDAIRALADLDCLSSMAELAMAPG